jgi:hypothetical protein
VGVGGRQLQLTPACLLALVLDLVTSLAVGHNPAARVFFPPDPSLFRCYMQGSTRGSTKV